MRDAGSAGGCPYASEARARSRRLRGPRPREGENARRATFLALAAWPVVRSARSLVRRLVLGARTPTRPRAVQGTGGTIDRWPGNAAVKVYEPVSGTLRRACGAPPVSSLAPRVPRSVHGRARRGAARRRL